MFDTFGLPPQNTVDSCIFMAQGSANTWQKWVKPRGATMIHMIAIGSGSGGGAGLAGGSGTQRCGGAGGGSGAWARLLIPAIMVPDVLYVQVGAGGAGGAASTNPGASGAISYISAGGYPDGAVASYIAAGNVFLKSGQTAAVGGGAGDGTGGVPGAAGETIANIDEALLGSHSGQWQSVVGKNGATGGTANNNGNAVTLLVASGPVVSGGGGGASCTATRRVGGAMNAAGPWGTIPGGAAAVGTGNAGAGGGGITRWNPFMSTGGAGGGSGNEGAGGAGGSGGIGSGGGGGGSGITGASGPGGRGGDGMVVIIAW